MTQEEKDLLHRDLCARSPYGVKVQFNYIITPPAILKGINKDIIECDIAVCEIGDIKPYLFPLSSMTKEQFNELEKLGYLKNCAHCHEIPFKLKWIKTFSLPLLCWLLENHFDINGLIEKGLAVDATGLNIY